MFVNERSYKILYHVIQQDVNRKKVDKGEGFKPCSLAVPISSIFKNVRLLRHNINASFRQKVSWAVIADRRTSFLYECLVDRVLTFRLAEL